MISTNRPSGPERNIDGGWAWVIAFGSFFSFFMFSGITRSQGILLEALIKQHGASTSQVTMVTTVSNLVMTIFSLFGPVLGEIYSARAVVMVASIIACLGMALASFGFNVPYIALTFGIGLGAGNGLMYGNCLATVGSYFRKKRALANSLALSGASVGQMALPPVISLIIEEFSVHGAFLILGGMYLQIAICGALYRSIDIQITPETSIDALLSIRSLNREEFDPEGKEVEDFDDMSVFSGQSQLKYADILKSKLQREEGMISKIGAVGGSTTSKIFFPYASADTIMSASLANLQKISHKVEIAFSQIISIESIEEERRCCRCSRRWNIPKVLDLSVLKNIKCTFFCLVYFLLQFTGFDFALFLPSIVADRGIRDYRSGLLLSIGGVADLLGRIACGFVANFGLCERYKVVVFCGITFGINILVFVTAYSYWQMALQYAIHSAVFGANAAVMPVVLIDCLGLEILPKVLGVVLFSCGLGPTFGQAFLGWLRDEVGGYGPILIILGLTGIISGVLLMFYPVVRKLEDKRVRKLEDKHDKSRPNRT